jgi:Transcriptional regulator
MNLSRLRYVKAVAETGSFTLAAEECHVTQPTLSNGIAQLEQEFEERIFERTTRAVALTAFGEHIMPFIDRMLKANDDLLREARKFAHPARAAVRIGVSPLVNADWLAAMLEKYREIRPEVEVILHEQNMADLYRMLDERLLELVFGVVDTRKAAWDGAFLYREPLYFIPRGANCPEGGGAVPFEKISGETFVMVPNVCGLARATRSLFRTHRRKLREYSGEAMSYQVLEQWAALGLGAAILPESKLAASQRKAYAITGKAGSELYLEFEAVWNSSQTHPQHVREFMEFLKGRGQGHAP